MYTKKKGSIKRQDETAEARQRDEEKLAEEEAECARRVDEVD